jgi:hypothetical protein
MKDHPHHRRLLPKNYRAEDSRMPYLHVRYEPYVNERPLHILQLLEIGF